MLAQIWINTKTKEFFAIIVNVDITFTAGTQRCQIYAVTAWK